MFHRVVVSLFGCPYKVGISYIGFIRQFLLSDSYSDGGESEADLSEMVLARITSSLGVHAQVTNSVGSR